MDFLPFVGLVCLLLFGLSYILSPFTIFLVLVVLAAGYCVALKNEAKKMGAEMDAAASRLNRASRG